MSKEIRNGNSQNIPVKKQQKNNSLWNGAVEEKKMRKKQPFDFWALSIF